MDMVQTVLREYDLSLMLIVGESDERNIRFQAKSLVHAHTLRPENNILNKNKQEYILLKTFSTLHIHIY